MAFACMLKQPKLGQQSSGSLEGPAMSHGQKLSTVLFSTLWLFTGHTRASMSHLNVSESKPTRWVAQFMPGCSNSASQGVAIQPHCASANAAEHQILGYRLPDQMGSG
jgi:hypothetical protein